MNFSAPSSLFDRINAALPQTQCRRCGFADCAAYAQSIALGEAAINQCPPGGAEGIERLSRITGLPAQPLNPANGVEGPRAVAIIDEAWCIGCTLCIKACPVDAIIGSHKLMHTVIESCCTGCELCIPVCPVDCISLENLTGTRTGWSAWSHQDAETARKRYEFHSMHHRQNSNAAHKKLPQATTATPAKPPDLPFPPGNEEAQRKRTVIQAALASARARRSHD